MREAVIGIGSNSLRLLVADMQGGQCRAILRDREGLRVFASLDTHNRIQSDMIAQAGAAVARMKDTALQAGARTVHLIATSAVRDATNQHTFADAMLAAAGLPLTVVSGETEAKLSFIGATNSVRSGMIDIGGGSTEVVIGEGETINYACSLQAGAVRLYREYSIRSAQDVRRVMDVVIALFAPHQPAIRQLKTPTVWVGVGGTMTAAATCVQNTAWNATSGVHGYHVEKTTLSRVTETLASLTVQQRQALGTLPPDRADIAVHGFAILLGCMEALNMQSITVSQQTNLDGYLKLLTKGE